MGHENEEITTVLGKGSVFEGKLMFEGAVRIDGRFSGEIRARGRLTIGESAHVAANVEADHIVVQGQVEGDLSASGGIEILAPARVQGTLAAPQLEIQRGAVFNGTCTMPASEAGAHPVAVEAAAEATTPANAEV